MVKQDITGDIEAALDCSVPPKPKGEAERRLVAVAAAVVRSRVGEPNENVYAPDELGVDLIARDILRKIKRRGVELRLKTPCT
jgi:hypothetical protein